MQGCTAIFNDFQVIENVRKAKTTFFAFRPLISPGWTYQSLPNQAWVLRSAIMRAMTGVMISCMAKIILPAGTTMVSGADMNDP